MGSSKKKKKRWTGAEKLRVVTEARGLSENELGALLRREGLHAAEPRSASATAATDTERMLRCP